jgi:hypothetical protein
VYPAIYAVWRQRSLARLTLSESIEETSTLPSLQESEDRLVSLKL